MTLFARHTKQTELYLTQKNTKKSQKRYSLSE